MRALRWNERGTLVPSFVFHTSKESQKRTANCIRIVHKLVDFASLVTKATVGGVPPISLVFEPLARVTLYLTDEKGFNSYYGFRQYKT